MHTAFATQVANNNQRAQSLTAELEWNDRSARISRAQTHMRGSSIVRTFGHWKDRRHPLNPPLECTRGHNMEEKILVQTLKIIERYAGFIEYQGVMKCKKCKGFGIGAKEFVFRPLEGGAVYRWPEGLQHYFQYHNAKIPHWMPELVKDFELAREKGHWQ